MLAIENKTIVRRFFTEVLTRGNLALIDEEFGPNYVYHDPAKVGLPPGREGIKQFVTMFRTAFPDLRFQIEDEIVEGDKVVTRWTAYGTHHGKLLGALPTNKPVTIVGTYICRFEKGKIAETWATWDTLGVLQVVGVLPQLEYA